MSAVAHTEKCHFLIKIVHIMEILLKIEERVDLGVRSSFLLLTNSRKRGTFIVLLISHPYYECIVLRYF